MVPVVQIVIEEIAGGEQESMGILIIIPALVVKRVIIVLFRHKLPPIGATMYLLGIALAGRHILPAGVLLVVVIVLMSASLIVLRLALQ